MKTSIMFMAIIALVIVGQCFADWNQYLGPDRNAISKEIGLLRSWSEAGPNVLWTFPLGEGFGGPTISDGKVYVLDRIKGKQDVLRCIDLISGKEEWSFAYDAPGDVSHGGSRSVPTIDGNFIYSCGCFGDLYCIDKRTHKPIWHKNIWKDFGGTTIPDYGIAQNPLIYGDLLIIASQTEKAGVVAYNKISGELKWVSKPFPTQEGYVSPTIVNIQGKNQIIMIGSSKFIKGRLTSKDIPIGVAGLDLQTGKILWTYQGWKCRIPIPNVTEIGDGRLFITGGYKSGSAMIKIEKKNNVYSVTELYKTQDFGTHVHPPILYKGHLYAQCTDNTGRRDGMVCMDLNGNVKWKTGHTPEFDKGGMILADDLILSIDGIRGILYLIEPNPDNFKVLASMKLLDTNQCWAPLALSDGKLLIRDQKQMKCVAIK
ncbi:TPA: hypothetical protein ENS27_05260 [bacterium]|nr:hypothetical protein [bacterium]